MTVIDCNGGRCLRAFGRARREYRELVFAANRAAEDAVLDVMALEGKVCVHYQPNTDHAAADRQHLRASTADAAEAVRRAKRGLLDTLAYIDGLDLPAPAPRSQTHVDSAVLDHRRAVFFSDALTADKGLAGGVFCEEAFSNALSAADELIDALQVAVNIYCREESQNGTKV